MLIVRQGKVCRRPYRRVGRWRRMANGLLVIQSTLDLAAFSKLKRLLSEYLTLNELRKDAGLTPLVPQSIDSCLGGLLGEDRVTYTQKDFDVWNSIPRTQ